MRVEAAIRHDQVMGTVLTNQGLSTRTRESVRGAPGFDLVVALSAATILVGVAYTLVPLWVAPDVWVRASGPFQTVFTAMLALTGPAIGFLMANTRRSTR